ncbi:MAG: SPFH domain-containing protein [Sporichthyaceae bacterium]
MGLIDKLKGELVDIVEWMDDSRSTLAWRFPRYNNEIKNGAQLIVREGQQAVFVYRGALADRFGPGSYELVTEALPVLSTLQGWKHGFQSPFRSEVYFINTRPVTDLRWGTPQPIVIRDQDFGPIPLRANGLCVVRIADPEIFLRQVIGTDSAVELEELTELLRRLIATAFADLMGGAGVSAIDLQHKNAELADKLRAMVAERVDDEFGLAIDSIAMNVSLPDEITAAMTAGVAKGLETRGYVQNVGDVGRLAQVRAADATLAAAENTGGGAGSMVGAGVGLALGQQMAGGLAAAAAPPPIGVLFHMEAGGQATGPFNLDQLRGAAASGQLTPATLVWTTGMAGWAPASSVAQLAPLFSTPPPIPPPPVPPTPSTPPPPPAQ